MGKRIKKPRFLYLGIFNYSHAVEEVLRFATSEKHAKALMMQELARKHEVHPSHVAALFDGSKPNYSIKIDPEWRSKHELQKL